MPELAWSEPTATLTPSAMQFRQLAVHEIAVAVVQARTRRAHERRLAAREDRDLGRLQPAGMDDQHALVDHAERFQPLDLGQPGTGDAGIMGGIAEAGVGLQQRAVAVGEPLEAGDQFIGGVVEAAERGAGAEPGMAGLGVAREHGSRRAPCATSVDSIMRSRQDAEHRFGEVERGARHDRPDPRRHHALRPTPRDDNCRDR